VPISIDTIDATTRFLIEFKAASRKVMLSRSLAPRESNNRKFSNVKPPELETKALLRTRNRGRRISNETVMNVNSDVDKSRLSIGFDL
jgi:hypothetical protein